MSKTGVISMEKTLNINGKIFHFKPYDEVHPRWDVTCELSEDCSYENEICHVGAFKHYGIGGLKGLVSEETVSVNEDTMCYNAKEQIEAARLGCDIIYEYIP